MSLTTHVNIPRTELPDLAAIQGLEHVGGHIPFAFRGSAAVAFDEDEDGIWTASIWPVRGDGTAEALALAAEFRKQGSYAWAYSQDPDEPLDERFGPRRPEAA